jgi:hypothetical protein
MRLFVPRQILPYVAKIGSPNLHRYIAEIVSWKELHDVLGMVDIMDKTSTEIFEAKKKALLMGDEAMLQQVGRGKDIMSILRQFLLVFPVFFFFFLTRSKNYSEGKHGSVRRGPSSR